MQFKIKLNKNSKVSYFFAILNIELLSLVAVRDFNVIDFLKYFNHNDLQINIKWIKRLTKWRLFKSFIK